MQTSIEIKAAKILRASFKKNGCVRLKNLVRQKEEQSSEYKKGFEVRLAANSADERDALLDACAKLEIRTGNPYAKCNQFVIPIYGKMNADRFLQIVRTKGIERRIAEAKRSRAALVRMAKQKTPPEPCLRLAIDPIVQTGDDVGRAGELDGSIFGVETLDLNWEW